jgi:hypothetical protein
MLKRRIGISEMYFCATVHKSTSLFYLFIYLFIISDTNILKYIYHTVKLKFYLVFQSIIKLTPLREPHIAQASHLTVKIKPLKENTPNRLSASVTLLKNHHYRSILTILQDNINRVQNTLSKSAETATKKE